MQWIIIMLFLLAAPPAWCGEISALVGSGFDTTESEGDVSWQLEYSEQLADHLEASFTYLNEGHLKEHHRDGHGLQLRARTDFFDHRLSVAAGAGPYLYYDTDHSDKGHMEVDRHGLALLSTLAATWHFDNRFLLQFRLNGVATSNSIDTVSALVGVGYQLDTYPSSRKAPESPFQPLKKPRNEITLFFGQTDVFNEGSSHSFATALEYRRGLLRYLEWSASLLYEGESDLIRRRGVATQLWLSKSFLNDRLSLGVGAGPYLAIDSKDTEERGGRDTYVLPVITMTAAYRFHPHWGARLSWNRVITDYDRDSDVWLAGVSYLF